MFHHTGIKFKMAWTNWTSDLKAEFYQGQMQNRKSQLQNYENWKAVSSCYSTIACGSLLTQFILKSTCMTTPQKKQAILIYRYSITWPTNQVIFPILLTLVRLKLCSVLGTMEQKWRGPLHSIQSRKKMLDHRHHQQTTTGSGGRH